MLYMYCNVDISNKTLIAITHKIPVNMFDPGCSKCNALHIHNKPVHLGKGYHDKSGALAVGESDRMHNLFQHTSHFPQPQQEEGPEQQFAVSDVTPQMDRTKQHQKQDLWRDMKVVHRGRQCGKFCLEMECK